MVIKINDLKIKVKKFKEIINEYNTIYKNYYHEFDYISNYWTSPYANNFNIIILEEKKQNELFYKELISLSSIFDYIIYKYKSFSDKLEFNFEGKELIAKKINDNKIKNIIRLYNELNNIDDNNIKSIINSHKEILEKTNNKLINYKDNIKKYYEEIEEIEKLIKYKLSQIKIIKIKETSKENKAIGDTERLIFNKDELERISLKMKMYIKDLELNIVDFKKNITDMKYDYNTSNIITIEEIEESIITKYETLLLNYYNNLNIINKNIELNIISSKKISNITDVINNIKGNNE